MQRQLLCKVLSFSCMYMCCSCYCTSTFCYT